MTTQTPEIDKLREQLRRIEIEGETFFVVEGDLLVPEEDFPTYAEERLAMAPPPAAFEINVGADTAQLVGIGVNGRLVRWAPGVVLSYHIRRETFTDAEYAEVRSSVVSATEAWMSTCGVEFRHLVDLDGNVAQREITPTLFHVRKLDSGGQFIAAAFFPNDPANRRRVFIDPSFFEPNLSFDRVGVLRHELGHVLGFRHEHIRSMAPPSCPNESLIDTIVLSQYDPLSVMHYFCGGVGSRTLAITPVDVEGSRRLYGPPLADFELVDP